METTIGNIADFQKGFAFKSKDYQDNGIRIVRVTNLNRADYSDSNSLFIDEDKAREYERYNLLENDVVISTVGSWPTNPSSVVGKVAVIPQEINGSLLNQNAVRLRAKSECLQEYLGYILQDEAFANYIVGTAQGSASQASITLEDIRRYTVDLPSIDEQKRRISILKDLDQKLKKNIQINRNLSEQVATLYKAWFIDFERYDGVCPEEWKEATLGDIAEIGSGKRPPMKQADKTDDVCIPLVGAASIMGYTNSVLYDSKILVTGRVGTHGVVQRFKNACWPSDNTLVITTDKYEFVNQILLGIDYKSMNRGSTQPLITQGDLKKTEIILPTDAILDEFEALAGGLMNQYEKNILENAKLSELRDTLLLKLMSGELDVSNLYI